MADRDTTKIHILTCGRESRCGVREREGRAVQVCQDMLLLLLMLLLCARKRRLGVEADCDTVCVAPWGLWSV